MPKIDGAFSENIFVDNLEKQRKTLNAGQALCELKNSPETCGCTASNT